MENNLIFGIRPVAEAIEAGKQIEKLYIRKGAVGQQIVVEVVAQVGHADKMFLLVQSQILGGRYEPGRRGG